MTRQRRAVIVGGSMGGLFAALALQQRGWHVDVFERNATTLSGRGAGIATHDRLTRALSDVGIPAPALTGVRIGQRRLYDAAGHVLSVVDYPQLNTSWDSVLGLLRAALSDDCYHLGRAVTGVSTISDQAVATFDDGNSVTADLLVAADGIRSTVRTLVAPNAVPAYAGYVAWRGLVEEAALTPANREDLMTSFAFCLPPGEQMLGYPVAGAENQITAGHRRFNFVWYRPADAKTKLQTLLTDSTGHRHAMSVPPPLVARSVIAEMRRAAATIVSPAFAAAVEATEMPFFQPIYDLTIPRMTFGRVVLIGDAAFIARPHVGAGVTKAAEDACALAIALDNDDVTAGLAAFDQTRTAIGARIVKQGRDLAAQLDPGNTAPTGNVDIIRDTASLGFLD